MVANHEAPAVLVVDDHVELAQLIADKLQAEGWIAYAVESGRAALAELERRPDVVITDLRMPDIDGFGVLAAVRRDTPVIVMTGFGDVRSAVEAMQRGAWQFVEKPVRMADLVDHVRRAVAWRRSRASALAGLVGTSPAMRELSAAVARVARTAAPVLVRGESGTGKELVARAIHAAGPRRDRPFVAINCAAIPDALVESELFGHVRGAFTGATSSRSGVFGEADGGTLFLDEIGDMPLAVQAKLLRVLQGGELRAIGAQGTHAVDVRVIAATHQDLEALVRAGRFRADLFYRLSVVPITVPPLRDRGEDIALLARHFLARARERDAGCGVHELAGDALATLAAYPWPGNVRELEHVIERLAILGGRPVVTAQDLGELAPEILGTAPSARAVQPERLVTLRELEDAYIERVLAHCGANKARAAEILGVDPSTLYRRVRARTPPARQRGE